MFLKKNLFEKEVNVINNIACIFTRASWILNNQFGNIETIAIILKNHPSAEKTKTNLTVEQSCQWLLNSSTYGCWRIVPATVEQSCQQLHKMDVWNKVSKASAFNISCIKYFYRWKQKRSGWFQRHGSPKHCLFTFLTCRKCPSKKYNLGLWLFNLRNNFCWCLGTRI